MMTKLFLLAHVAGQVVAIDSDDVESVVDITQVTPVPRTIPQIRGLAALRSRVVTVVDTRAALGLPPLETEIARAVITQLGGHHYAVMVDSVEDVAPFVHLPLLQANGVGTRWKEAARGMIDRDGEPVLVISLSALVPGVADAA